MTKCSVRPWMGSWDRKGHQGTAGLRVGVSELKLRSVTAPTLLPLFWQMYCGQERCEY